MGMKNIFIRSNDEKSSIRTGNELEAMLKANGFVIQNSFSDETDLVISIGGDGTFLRSLKSIGFADVPILGINTGHLGFFTEFIPSELNQVVEACKSDNFIVQTHKTIKTTVETNENSIELDPALNDVLIKNLSGTIIHLDLYIGGSFIESFSGDGLLVSTPSGSTAYNYALGGSIIDPRLSLLQVTPMAPINNSVYRNFTSSLLAPESEEIIIVPCDANDAVIIADGCSQTFEDIKKITLSVSEKDAKIARLFGFDFWDKVKSKFL